MKTTYLILIFVSGILATIFFTSNNSSETKSLNYFKSSKPNNLLQKIQNQQEIILYTIQRINRRLDEIENNNHLSEDSANIEIERSIKELSKLTKEQNKINLSADEIQRTKYQIFDSLLSATMTVAEALNSPKLNALPKTAKLELIKEIVGRYNSGELPR